MRSTEERNGVLYGTGAKLTEYYDLSLHKADHPPCCRDALIGIVHFPAAE